MSVRTLEQLYDFLSGELAWRTKELVTLKSLVEQTTPSRERRRVLLRAGVALLYAHWEGFVKRAGSAYLEFVDLQRLKNQELSPTFLALSARKLLRAASQSDKLKAHIDLTTFFLSQLGAQCSIPFRNAINTKSNLSSSVLRTVLEVLGLDYSVYVTKEKLLDEKLLTPRNAIAHGEYLTVTEESYLELHNQVLEMMKSFLDQIDNAATLGQYRSAGSSRTSTS